MTGTARRRAAAVSDALRDFDHALGRKPDFAPSLDDLADTLHSVTAALDQLKRQVVLSRIDRADLDSVIQSIEALHGRCRKLERLAGTTLPAPPPHADAVGVTARECSR
jgi:hypothetical protein